MEKQVLLVQAVIGGLYVAFYTYILDGQAERLPELMPDLLYCALVPYLGHAAAMTADQSARRGPDQP